MACVYNLKDSKGQIHQFQSELELDEFLLERGYLQSKLGDIVFSITGHQTQALNILDDIKKKYEVAKAKRGERVWDEDGKTWKYNSPTIGVNAFLALFKNPDTGELLFPIFNEDNYWEGLLINGERNGGRYADWRIGKFNESELELFFDGDESKAIAIKDEKQLKRFREMMTEKWEFQALNGDAIHSIMELLFTRDAKTGEYFKDIIYTDSEAKSRMLEELYKNKYQRRDKSEIKFEEILEERVVENTINEAKNLIDFLNKKYEGQTVLYFPEFGITGNSMTLANNGAEELVGVIDLLAVPEKGNPDVYDYKTSLKDISKFDSTKQLTYMYQLSTYGRMLALSGFNTDDTDYYIIPIQLADFLKRGEMYTMSGVNFHENIVKHLNPEIVSREYIGNNLDNVINQPYVVHMSSNELLQDVRDAVSKFFPTYSLFKKYTDEEIRQEIQDGGGFTINPESGLFEFKVPNSKNDWTIKHKTEKEMFEHVKRIKESKPRRRREHTILILKALKESIEQGSVEGIEFPKTHLNGEPGASQIWFKEQMSKYANSNWEVMEGEDYNILRELGIITLFNKTNAQFDFIKISGLDLYRTLHFSADKSSNNLAGAFNNDLHYQSQTNNLMLEGTTGNIELIEAMLAINNVQGIFGNNGIVGRIQVCDPIDGFGISASNAELLYCFNELEKCASKDGFLLRNGNNFKSEKIKLASKAHIAKQMLNDIVNLGELSKWEGHYADYVGKSKEKIKKFRTCKSALDLAIDDSYEHKLDALEELRKYLEKNDKNNMLMNVETRSEIISQEQVALYYQVLQAIAELKGINFRQQLRDHSKWCENLMIHKYGLSGTYIDNPGNLNSETLNLLTRLVTEAYLNVRNDMQEPIARISELVKKLKSDKGFNKVLEHTVGNLADLYSNLYDFSDGDIKFKHINDSSLTSAERELLDYALTTINKRRFSDKSDVELENMKKEGNINYYQVPLAKGDSSSFASRKGLLAALKDRLQGWDPTKAVERAKDAAEGFFSKERKERIANNQDNLFEMTNIFDKGMKEEERLEYIAKKKVEYFEANLETLLLKHEFAYSTKEHIDNIMPMIKAAMVHLSMQGNMHNRPFENDIQYAKDYIKSKIRNESLIPDEYRGAAEILSKVRNAASKMVLALSPVQAIYQTLQAIWNDVSLMIRKPDGTLAFSFKNMRQAFKLVYSDLFAPSNDPTICSRFNELYGINDMDMNTYIDRIKSDNHGVHNLSNFLMKFSSRPDYYSRMTIMVSKMLNDGCYEAHYLEKGKLKYDWKRDKRFEAFANGWTSDSRYNDLKALYYAVAKQFESEHAKVIVNGKEVDFRLNMEKPMDLPQAYTNKEAESIKSLADTIYGYYSHEKKSLMQSTFLGCMWMQFKTFWSGKKNQYLATGGVKLEGKWVEYTERENGKDMKFYYQVDANGNVLYDAEPLREDVATNKSNPVIVWQGDWKEGILSTLMNLGGNIVTQGGIKDGFNALWYNEDANLRNAYRNNLKQLSYDLIMWGIVGTSAAALMSSWYDEEKKDAVKGNLGDGFKLAMINIAAKSVTNSFLDFNFIESIGAPGYSWTPFAFEYLGNLLKNVYKVLTGDEDIFDAMVMSNSAMRQTKPFWNAIKVNMFEE